MEEQIMAMTTERWMKYMALAMAFAGVASRVFLWLQQAQAENSPGGDDIEPSEMVQLQSVIEDAVNQGLQGAKIPIIATVTLTYLGD